MFSKTCEYAIKIMIHLTVRDKEGRAGLAEIADAIASPKAFTAKILQLLTRAGLLDSVRGPGGGFSVVGKEDITLNQIVKAIDGDGVMVGCVLGFRECNEQRPCPVHHRFGPVRDFLSGTLSTTTLREIREVMVEGRGFLREDEQ
jgi:Rrf2 family protein